MVEVGAQWIGPTQDRLAALAAELEVATFPTWSAGENVIEYAGRLRRYTGAIPRINPAVLVDVERGRRRLNKLARRVPLDAPWAANNFLHAALHGQPLKLLGGGDAVRSYLYGSDMAVLALHQLVGGRSGDTFDLGGAEEMSLIGFDDVLVSRYVRPRLTTVRYPIVTMAQQAAELALALAHGKPLPEITNLFSPTLVRRHSVGAPP